jgi:hypothetical protein
MGTHTVTVHGKSYDLKVEWEEEQENYRDVYGDDPPEGYEFFWVNVPDPRGVYASLASLGFVDVPIGPNRAALDRQAEVEKELVAEAVAVLEKEERPGTPGAACETV